MTDATRPQLASACDALAVLARLLGVEGAAERLRAALSLLPAPQGLSELPELAHSAGLVATWLPTNTAVSGESLPALTVAPDGTAIAVLALKHGSYECHVPPIEGSRRLSPDELRQLQPEGRWLAVRAPLRLDERSGLYAPAKGAGWFRDAIRRNRWIFGWALLGALTLNVIGALIPFYTMAVYDRVLPNNAMASLAVLSVAVAGAIVFECWLRLLRSQLLESAARRIDVELSARIFGHCLQMRAAQRPASGGVLANTVREFESVREFVASGTLTILGDLPFMLVFLGVIAVVGGWLVAVPLVCIPLLLGVSWSAKSALARQVGSSMQASAQRTALLFEAMNGIDGIKAQGAEAWCRRKWEGLTVTIARQTLQTREVSARLSYINAAVLALASASVVALGAVLADAGAVTMGQIVAASLLTGRALAPASQLAGLMARWEQTRLSYGALDRIMRAPVDDETATLSCPPLSGALEFRDVEFAYPNAPRTLERVNLRIAAGERVGIIGKLGSGKSTLLRLLLNQYAPDRGSVLLDGLVTTQLQAQSLRRQIGYVAQDLTLFHGTVRENVELGRIGADDAQLIEAMKRSGLDELVAQLPGGAATAVGERGERLSGGQRQLVALARALLGSPPILLLDEPSSMLDPGTEQRLIARLRNMPGCTIVVVTHRAAMLELVDRLVVMDAGKVVLDGPRQQVLEALAARAQPAQVRA